MIPRATYRLQLHKDFPFDAAVELAPYLARLGVSHVYASPILMARPGSLHGYDVIDHRRINPELGGEAGFARLSEALKAEGIGIILDIVPNHMAVGGADNAWWLDVLERGRESAYAGFFDIDFDTPRDPSLKDKILAPFLGAPYGEVLRSGDLKLLPMEGSGKFAVAYHHHRFPIRPRDQEMVAEDPEAFAAPGPLHALLERQHFRLAWWRTAGDDINWRRFFNITELAGLRVERLEVFEAVHALIFDLYAEGVIDGIRVDHVDGLADPAAYCRALRGHLDRLSEERPFHAAPGPAYLVVEKILGAAEALPADWDVDGTSGYDFMNQVSALQHDPAGADPLSLLWRQVSGRSAEFETEELAARAEILTTTFDGQLGGVAASFHRLARRDPATRDLTEAALRRGIGRLIPRLRVYRTYATGMPGSPDPGPAFATAAAQAIQEMPNEDWPVRFIAECLARDDAGEPVRRLNQLSAPVAAKAVEDTAFYRYGRLLSRNDVGFDPGRLAMEPAEFHEAMEGRAAAFPHALLATATHDHKRGEDARARLAVLSELPDEWAETVSEWFTLNAAARPAGLAPDDEYQLYQTLVGAWPLELAETDQAALTDFRERIAGWRLKSLREAKLRSSWAAPNEAYEGLNREFLECLLDPLRSQPFLASLKRFIDHIAPAGALNGLVQLVLKMTLPGVPDTYQGTELWDFSLVDPDNRRPVDFARRQAALEKGWSFAELMDSWRDGGVKQHVVRQLLTYRASEPDLFRRGGYRRLAVDGARQDNVLAFQRRHGDRDLIVIVPRVCASPVVGSARPDIPSAWWQDTQVSGIESGGARSWTHLFDGEGQPEQPVQAGLGVASLPLPAVLVGAA